MSINAFSPSFSHTPQPDAGPLAVAAIDALRTAITVQPKDLLIVEERSFWQPDSWLIQRCWEELADAGYARQAMLTADLVSQRYPLAPIQTIQRLSKLLSLQPALRGMIQAHLHNIAVSMTANSMTANSKKDELADGVTGNAEALLSAAHAAMRIDASGLALAFLERIDQLAKSWEQLIAKPEFRQTLAEIIARLPPHPLVYALLSDALRRFGDAGAMFLHDIAHRIDLDADKKAQAILTRCVDAFHFGMLATPQSQRLAIATYGRAGLVNDVLQQADTLTNILEARRQSALDRQSDQHIVRQVKRPAANADADFQVYALTEAIHSMDVRTLSREQRVSLANRLALTSRRSDGWTAASAAQTLVELGALKFATEAVERIAPTDPTKVEAVISLVRALLGVNEFESASEQVKKALIWAEDSPQGRLHKQALIRGLGEVYLASHQPALTWQLLDRAQPDPTIASRIQSWFGERWDDDMLRNEALRLRALLHPEGARLSNDPRGVATLVAKLQKWGKQLLDGEALVNFMLDSLLRPLLEAGLISQVWALLPELQDALSTISGDKHANRVHIACTLLAEQALPMSFNANTADVEERLGQFLQQLWAADAQRNVWQIVHGIEGSLPLLIALEGAESVLAIAQTASSIIGSTEDEVIDGGEQD